MRIISEYEDIMARLQSEGKPYWAVKDDEANYTMQIGRASCRERV